MSNPIIRLDQLGKKYTLGQRSTGGGMRHLLQDALMAPLRRLGGRSAPPPSDQPEEFWALRDISFEIMPGEVVGIVGRNGAGKSTLLKILSRITEPTCGRVEIDGRIASLLEVGTGFHPELTGRENIFLNGAILGMTRGEIRRKFDEIVAFAEVERFLDTPVKHYSSGMYVRLAFAVAAHLEPEILIIDEVLAVGDAQFQKKCLGKMQDVSTKEGRTVLFVSHNMATVSRLCTRGLLLQGGRLQESGPIEEIISSYLKSNVPTTGLRAWPDEAQPGHDTRVRIRALRVVNHEGEVSAHLDIRHEFTVEVEYEIIAKMERIRIALRFFTSEGILAFVAADSTDPGYESKPCGPGLHVSRCTVPGKLLNEGTYSLTVSGDIPFVKILWHEENVVEFTVEQTGGNNTRFAEKWPGVICPQLSWQTLASARHY